MKKSLLIYYCDMDIGGIQKRIYDIAWYLENHFPSIGIYLLLERYYDTPLIKRILKLKNIKIDGFMHKPGYKKDRSFSSLWLLKKVYQLQPDLILTFLDRKSIQMAIIRKLLFWRKTKLVISEEIYTSRYVKMYSNVFWEKLITLFYPSADIILTLTKTIKNNLIQQFHIPRSKIAVISNWIIDHRFIRVSSQRRNKYDFIYIGRLEKEKNVWWLIELITYLNILYPNISLCVLGDGKLKNQFIKTIKKKRLQKNICYYGFRENVFYFLNQSKILLLPSQNEGMPNCVLEAASYQVPAIVNNFPGADEVIQHGKTGYIAKGKQDFINLSRNLLGNDKLRIKVGIIAQKYVTKKYGESNLRQFVKLLINN